MTCAHYRNRYDLPAALYGAVMASLCRTALAVQQVFQATGSTIRQNNEPPGHDVFHVHFHAIPRHMSDNSLAAGYQPADLVTRVAQARAMRSILASP